MHKIFILIITFAFTTAIYAQSDAGDQILIGLKKWHDSYPQEKVFLQSDKEKYLAGTSIWFSLWCTLENKPSFLSRIVYVELVDENGTVADKKMFQLDKASSANGIIDINKDIKSGNYTLNAYSLWMLNYPKFVFKKSIFIYNTDYNAKNYINKKNNPQLTFFPEGGDMIEQVTNRIAFKSTNESGFPVTAKGTVYDNSGNKILDFKTQHDGMGVFDILPVSNIAYTAKVIFENGTNTEYQLPVAKKEGATLQVQNTSPTRIFIIVNRSPVNKEKYNNLFVVAQINGNTVYKANYNLDEGESGSSIIKKNLPPGIIQITLFDSSGNPLAERLSFVDNHQIIDPAVSLETHSTNKRGLNIYSFRLDSLSTPAMSAIVINSSIEPGVNVKENIASSFLLSSDIKGYIHNPGFYFSNKQPATLQKLDLLLMTQGWRRFTWKQVKGEELISLKYPVETFMNIKGKVTKSDRPEPITSGFVSFIIKGEDSTSILSNAYITDKGEFIIDSLYFKTKAQVSYQGTNNNKAQLAIDVNIYPAYIDTLKKSRFTPETIDSNALADKTELPEYLKSGLKSMESARVKILENVVINVKKLSRTDSLQKEYVSAVYDQSDQTLVIPDNRNYLNIWQYLNANVPGLNVNPFQVGGVTNISFGRYDGLGSPEDSDSRYVKFLLNEIPVTADVVDGINPLDVALIKIYKGALGLAFGADAGAISVYTKKGANVGSSVFDKKYLRLQKMGFAVSREYYKPNYTSYPDFNKNEVDDREILYWNPSLKPGKAGNYIVDFHNSDVVNSYKLIIQGIDKNGKLIYKEQIIK